MHLIFGRYIESISIIKDHRRGHNGICKTSGLVKPTREADLLCKMAGPVATLLWQGSELSRKALFSQMWDEGVFDVNTNHSLRLHYPARQDTWHQVRQRRGSKCASATSG